jgi:hypothetical protein
MLEGLINTLLPKINGSNIVALVPSLIWIRCCHLSLLPVCSLMPNDTE